MFELQADNSTHTHIHIHYTNAFTITLGYRSFLYVERKESLFGTPTNSSHSSRRINGITLCGHNSGYYDSDRHIFYFKCSALLLHLEKKMIEHKTLNALIHV